jgi:hypothetical protein
MNNLLNDSSAAPGLSFSSVVGTSSMPERQPDFRPGQNDFPALGGVAHISQSVSNSTPQGYNTLPGPLVEPAPSNNDPYSLFGLIDIIRLTDHDSAMVSLGYVSTRSNPFLLLFIFISRFFHYSSSLNYLTFE